MHSLLVKSTLTATVALVFLSISASAGEPPKNNVFQRHGQSCRGTVGGFPVLVLRGTHRERGEAHGFLAAKEIIKTCDAMAAAVNGMDQSRTEGSGWSDAKVLMSRFQFPERFQVELAGMLQGIQEALPEAGDRTLKATGAEVTLDDLRVLQCGDVLELMRCSQFSAWGSLTPDGSTIIGRNWDYPPIFPHDTYCAFAVDPAEEGLQKTMDAMWFGMIGAGMACLNEEGVYLSGNDAGSEDPSLVQSPVPAALAARMAGETARASDPLAAVQRSIDQKTALALLYHIVAPGGPGDQGSRAFVFEHAPGATSPFEERIRRPSSALANALILTNDPLIGCRAGAEVCERYARIEEALFDPDAQGKVGFEKARSILDSVAAVGPGTTTQYSAVVSPGRKEMRIAVAPAPEMPATKQDYVILQWDAVFGLR
ncbi:MAG: C45 family peptidase [Armatimonadetes bacterium]|nr:C45 family peptidase [Armatimonadota bacterium]